MNLDKESKKLYAITTVFNPAQYKSRYLLFNEFEKRCKDQNIILYTVEAIFEGQEYQVTESNNRQHIQIKAESELWHKEQMINVGRKHLPSHVDRFAWFDADVIFTNPNIAQATYDALDEYDVVQMFGTTYDLDSQHELLFPSKVQNCMEGYMYRFFKEGYPKIPVKSYHPDLVGHTGYAWAIKCSTFDAIGGLANFAIMGSADRYIANSLIGGLAGALSSTNKLFSDAYNDSIIEYGKKCEAVKPTMGYVPGLCLHYYHGSKSDRHYWGRNKILFDYKFDPKVDIELTEYGLFRFTNNKPGFKEAVFNYFLSRKEDLKKVETKFVKYI